MTGVEALNKVCDALGIDPKKAARRLVIEIDVNKVPLVYVTSVLRADDVLRVVETLSGPEVIAAADGSVEVIELGSNDPA